MACKMWVVCIVWMGLMIGISGVTAETADLTAYFKKVGASYKAKSADGYPIYYRKVDANGTDIPRVVARMYVPTTTDSFVRAMRECNRYSEFLPGQSKAYPTRCTPPGPDGKFIQTAVMDLPWPLKDLKYQTVVTPFDLSNGRLVERWTNIEMVPDKKFGHTTQNNGSWTIVAPDPNGFFLQYEFLVVPSTHVPAAVKGWLADAALEEIIEGMVNRAMDPKWVIKRDKKVTYHKIKVRDFGSLP